MSLAVYNLSVQVIHCILRRKILASRDFNETLYGVMKEVIKVVNLVKAPALNSHLFEDLCLSCGAYHQELLFHSRDGNRSGRPAGRV